MTRKAAAWGGFWAAFGAADFALNRRHDGSTLSEVTRYVFHTDTPAGRAAFTAFLVGGGYLLHRHICK